MNNLSILMAGTSISVIIDLSKLSYREVCEIANSDLSSIPEDWRDLARAIQKMAITNKGIDDALKAMLAKRT